MGFARVDFDDITLMQCRNMLGLLARADATSGMDLSCMGTCAWPLHMKDVVHADCWWQGARSAGLPAQTKHWGLRLARGIRDPAMEAVVVIRFAPSRVQSCGDRRRRCAGHLAARRAKQALDLSLVLRVRWWSIIHGPWDRRTDATKCTASQLAAVVAYELPWDALREHGSVEYFTHRRDRLSLLQPAGDDRAGMIVQEGHQIASKAVLLVGVEITDIHRPYDMRRQSCKGVPAVSRAWNRGHRWSILLQDTLHGMGGDEHALVVEKVCQSLLAEARVLCLRTQHGLNDRLRFGGAVDMGSAITGCQTPLLGLMTVLIKGVAGEPEETGDHHHTEDMRSDQTQPLGFDVIQSGLNLHWQ
jgi:hypothetical protein